tara:strand:+ start:313 stop:513 length:201 start_codon:yes stop_codon:yes gene_type:complete
MIPLLILSYLNLPMKDDISLLKTYPDIHRYCNKYVSDNINLLVQYKKPIYFTYLKDIDYPIKKYNK